MHHEDEMRQPVDNLEYDRLTYDEADARLRAWEDDYKKYETDNKHRPAEWWDESKRKVQQQMADLRQKMDKAKENAPSAWEEMKTGISNAFRELSEGYHRTIREMKD